MTKQSSPQGNSNANNNTSDDISNTNNSSTDNKSNNGTNRKNGATRSATIAVTVPVTMTLNDNDSPGVSTPPLGSLTFLRSQAGAGLANARSALKPPTPPPSLPAQRGFPGTRRRVTAASPSGESVNSLLYPWEGTKQLMSTTWLCA